MDERGAHYTAVVAALVLPALAFLALQRTAGLRHASPPDASMQVAFVLEASPEQIPDVAPPAIRRDESGSRSGRTAANRPIDGSTGGEPSDPADEPGVASRIRLDLRVPDQMPLEFPASAGPPSGQWRPSLPRLKVRMEDASFGGRLHRMQKAATCKELRMMLSGPGAAAVGGGTRELVMQELRELGCLHPD